MLANTNGKFETLITQLLIDKRYEKALRKGLQLYQIKQYKISQLAPTKIKEMYYHITTKFYYNRVTQANQSWHENQLRVFIYLLVGYSYLQDREIYLLDDSDWLYFSQIFNNRGPLIFQFQALSILKRNPSSNRWDIQEVSLLDSIIRAKSIKNKWNEIARDLFIHSGKQFFKTAKQCREYWINHLDPVPVRTSWTTSEDCELVNAVLQIGKKWAKVSKMLGGRRTEHMVKNRFKSLYQFEVKQQENSGYSLMEEREVIQMMADKYQDNLEEAIKLSQIQQGFRNSNGQERDEIERPSLQPNPESLQSGECPSNYLSLGKHQSSRLTEPEDSAKQKLYFCTMGSMQSAISNPDISLEECIDAYFDNDSFMHYSRLE